MSLVYITYHNENIFDVVPSQGSQIFKRQAYQSKFKGEVRKQSAQQSIIELEDGKKLLTSANKSRNKTMGYAETPLNPPCDFLRKNHGVKWQRFNDHVCPKSKGMPDVPKFIRQNQPKKQTVPMKVKKTEKDSAEPGCNLRLYLKDHKHRADFMWINIDRVKSSKAKRPPPRYVDTPVGDTHNLLNTGLIPQYICSKNFGKVPCYLRVHQKKLDKIKKACALEQKQYEERCEMQLSGIRKLTPNERYGILTGLKTNYAEIYKIYLGQPLYVDTIAKQLRKGKLEKELRQLEQDIFLIESNPQIFVSEH